ncbi:arabinose ABC transporter permease [Microbacterium sediminis]|uniref:Arabinose ABC transporter permease n=2 Tax=Microbacterium sediminis TaxID=904291 RepID=A0A1B9NC90_9MICO|nr:MFS transporter [Microbacterium sediminis]OCG74216.1 arabinose ABC transporter permease [Microbacterium sediminis]QBR75357.1 MFS transporter [Microbacterium sediminis]
MALLSLAIGAFGIGMTEFVSMGLLPGIASDLLPALYASDTEEAIARAGMLISLYALGVVIGAPTIAGFASRFPRHRVVLVLVAALLVFNGLTVIAPTFELVAISRFLSGVPHGAYFGMGALVASELLGPAKRGRAVSLMMTGLTVANVVGVPAGTFLGQAVGWRAAYIVVALVFAAALVMCGRFLPAQPGDPGRTFRHELRVFLIPQVWFAIGIGAIGFGAFFAIYSYVATLVTEAAGAPEWLVPFALMALGLGMVVGNLFGGRLADASVTRTLLVGLAGMSLVSVVVAVLSSWSVALIAALFVFGLIAQLINPAIQLRLFDVAHEHQALAGALNHSALNIGNSVGAAVGGAVIAAGFGYVAPAWAGAVLAAAGAVIAVASLAVDRRAVRVAA